MFAGKLRAGRPSCPIRHSQRPTPEGDWASRRKLAERSPCSASVSGIHAATTVPHLARRPLAPRKQRRRLVLGRRGSLPQERHLLPVPELPPRLLDLLLSVDTILPTVYTSGRPQKRMIAAFGRSIYPSLSEVDTLFIADRTASLERRIREHRASSE